MDTSPFHVTVCATQLSFYPFSINNPLPITHTTKFFRYFPIKKKRIYIFARRKIIINKSWTTITRITTFEADRKQTS